MSFDWLDYHALACELAIEDSPAKKRTSINRSYYSAYCMARDFLINNQIYLDKDNKEKINSKKSEAHYEVRKTFNELYSKRKKGNKKIGRKIYKSLDRLRSKRNDVDYEKIFKNLNYSTNKCIIDSRYVLDNLENFI